jgi:hypothetical protein
VSFERAFAKAVNMPLPGVPVTRPARGRWMRGFRGEAVPPAKQVAWKEGMAWKPKPPPAPRRGGSGKAVGFGAGGGGTSPVGFPPVWKIVNFLSRLRMACKERLNVGSN